MTYKTIDTIRQNSKMLCKAFAQVVFQYDEKDECQTMLIYALSKVIEDCGLNEEFNDVYLQLLETIPDKEWEEEI